MWFDAISKFDLMINSKTVSQEFTEDSMKIKKGYWVGFQAKNMTKTESLGFHDLSDYFDYWEGRTKYKYSKFFMFMVRKIRVMLLYTSKGKKGGTSYFQAQCKL